MQHLFKKYLENQCSPEEVKQLLAYFDELGNETALRKLISESLEEEHDPNIQWDNAANEVYGKVRKQMDAGNKRVIPLFGRAWFRAAAIIILFGSVLSYVYLKNNHEKPVADVEVRHELQNDIAPGGSKAVLTLANGSSIVLDSARNGTLARQGNADVQKLSDGEVIYDGQAEGVATLVYNSISTPRGGQYQLTLADGSKVWLNAASSIRFPVSFTGKERRVEVTGEAYFEIAKDAARPFHVIHGNMDVKVLGTHFNVNSYEDEQQIKVTLLEGAVQLSSGPGNEAHLKPGMQGRVKPDGKLSVTDKINIDEVMAWKDGQFRFRDADLKSIMRQIARWYDVDVEFSGNTDERFFTADISRNKNLSAVLRVLEMSNVHCKIEDRKLIVTP